MQDDWGTKLRVGTALSLLVGAKVCSIAYSIVMHSSYLRQETYRFLTWKCHSTSKVLSIR